MKHIVMFSSGIGSWAAARRLVETVDPSDVTLLFADTLIEDEDNYRFLHEAASDIGAELVIVADGRTPIEAMRDWGRGLFGQQSRRPMRPHAQAEGDPRLGD